MRYPLFVKGEECGMIEAEREGLYTRIKASAEIETPVRLWLHGAGASVYLGIASKGAELSRKYTKMELGTVWDRLEYASDHEGAACGESAPEAKPSDAADGGGRDRIWHRAGAGTLVTDEKGVRLIALPCSVGAAVKGADIRIIEGREYMIFRY